MRYDPDRDKPISAAQAGRPTRRKRESKPKAAAHGYTITRDGEVVAENVGLGEACKLFPGRSPALIRRRLQSGERDYHRLARPADTTAMRKRGFFYGKNTKPRT